MTSMLLLPSLAGGWGGYLFHHGDAELATASSQFTRGATVYPSHDARSVHVPDAVGDTPSSFAVTVAPHQITNAVDL